MIPGAFDYVVVGAGSAGCVVASRLSEDPKVSVLLLEAGGAPHWWDFRMHIPAAKGTALKDANYNWGYTTLPQAQLNNREISWHQGKVLGGSSAINGMVFVRGNRSDYDNWAKDPGLSGWDFASVLPYFKRLETYSAGDDALRGGDGPVGVQAARGSSPLSRVFIAAGAQAGHATTDDPNGAHQEGFGLLDMTVQKGRRVSTWDAYIRPVRKRPNLTVLSNAQAVRLEFEHSRCTGLAYARNGEIHHVQAGREVIACSGAIGSPALLLRSGVGPAEDLRRLGIPVRKDLPGVGENLHDHLQISVINHCTQPVTLHRLTKRHTQYLTAMRWLLTRTGWGATNHFEAGGFVRSSDAAEWPDIQFHFSPHAISRSHNGVLQGDEGYQVHAGPQRPRSRGRITLRSALHTDPPRLDPCYLTHPDDLADTRIALRLARAVLSQKAFDPYRGEELAPGAQVQSQSEMDAFIRATADTGYHPCGTCKMGSGPDAVVDGKLRVIGIRGLRVCDGSIMPSIPSGNLNAPTIMIAEKACDLIREG